MAIYEDYKEVYFGQYCQLCKHETKAESEMPCAECLEEPINLYSNKPVRFEAKEAKK